MRKSMLVLVSIFFILTGCSSEPEEEAPIKTPEGSSYVHPMVQNMAFQEQKDGWLYYMSIQYDKINQESEIIEGNYDKNTTYANFNGINLKYKEMKDVYLPITDRETGEEIDQGHVSIPTLTTLQSVKDEVKTIDNFLQEKKFVDPITLTDLENLSCDSFDKQLLVNLYNQALENEPTSFGMFAQLPAANLLQVRDLTGRTWQGGYMSNYGSTGIVRFECIQDGVNLSDIIEVGTATEAQIKIQANLDQMEAWIMETQVFSIDDIVWLHPDVMDEEIRDALHALLKKLYTGNRDI